MIYRRRENRSYAAEQPHLLQTFDAWLGSNQTNWDRNGMVSTWRKHLVLTYLGRSWQVESISMGPGSQKRYWREASHGLNRASHFIGRALVGVSELSKLASKQLVVDWCCSMGTYMGVSMKFHLKQGYPKWMFLVEYPAISWDDFGVPLF